MPWLSLADELHAEFSSLVVFDRRDRSLFIRKLREDDNACPERRKAKTMAQRKYDAVRLAPAKQEKADLKLLASALIASGMSMRAAAKHMGIDRTTIAKWVKSKEASQ